MTEMETVHEFRRRARAWIRENLAPLDRRALGGLRGDMPDEEELAAVAHDRELQRRMFDAGLAGVCFPREYGGQGLTPAHQTALNEELTGFEYPSRFQVPTLVPCAALILEFGTEEQKLRHLPAVLRGDVIWIQLLSEPSGGSDVAGALTTAVRDGEEWVLNGSKVWSSGAWWSDWGLCLARTNWDVPKHRGLTVFMLPLHQPGVEIRRIEMLNGSREFCEEFFTDVRVPDADRLGEVDDGWTVGSRWMIHERMADNSPYVTAPLGARRGRANRPLAPIVQAAGRTDDPVAIDLLGEAHVLSVVGHHLHRRLGDGLASGTIHPQSPAIGRLFAGVTATRRTTIAFELAGDGAAVWDDADPQARDSAGLGFLMRQTACIAGGTTEIARNVIAERVLGMPRELAPDRDVRFRDVPRGGR